MMMKKTLLSTIVLLALAACGGSQSGDTGKSTSSGSNQAATNALNIFNWSNYVDESTVEDFKKQNNLKLNYTTYESNEALEAKMLTGQSGYDLAVPGVAFLPRQIQAGAYQKINKDLIPNYKNIDPALLKLLTDASPDATEYAVPYFMGANTIAITAKGKEALGGKLPENGWDLLFKPEYTNKLKGCGITLWDTPSEMFPIVLKYIGKDPKGSNPADVDAAAAVLQAIRPDVKRFSPSVIDELARGDVCLAAGNGGLNLAKARSEEVKNNVGIEVLNPKGMGIWVESWVIPKDAKNVANAHKYINYTLDPEVAAKNGNAVTFAPASLPAREKMDPKLVATRSIFPTAEDIANGFVMPQMSDATKKQTTQLWQKLKMGK